MVTVPKISPGEHIADELRIIDIYVATFAVWLSVPVNRVIEMLNGQVAVTRHIMLRLADSMVRLRSSG